MERLVWKTKDSVEIDGDLFVRYEPIAALTEPQPLEQAATEARILGYADSGGGIRRREDAGGYTGHLWSGAAPSAPSSSDVAELIRVATNAESYMKAMGQNTTMLTAALAKLKEAR